MGKQAKGAAKDVMKEVMSHTEEAMSPDAKAMLEKLKGEYQVRMEKAEEDFLKDLQVKMESSKAALQAKAAEMEKEFNEKKDQLKHDLKLKMDQELSEQLDKRMLPLLQESLLSDEMPAWVHEEVNDTVVAVWPDVKQELWSVYQDSVLKYEPIPAGMPV